MNAASIGSIIGLLLVAILVWRLIAKWRRRQPLGPMSTWGQKPATIRSAAELADAIRRLQASNAQWPEIIATINPKGKRSAARVLKEIQVPHQFIPHVGLNVLEDGCRRALARNSRATAKDALAESLRSSDKVIRAGD